MARSTYTRPSSDAEGAILADSSSPSPSKCRARLPIKMDLSTGDVASRAAPRQPNIRKQDSKTGLRALFTWNKTEKEQSPVSPVVEQLSPCSEVSEKSVIAVADASLQLSLTLTRPKTSDIESDVSPTSPPVSTMFRRLTSKPSRIGLGAGSTQEMMTPSTSSPSSLPTPSSPPPPAMSSAVLNPLPFFQACHQAVRYAQLSASTLSTDVILRLSGHLSNSIWRDESGPATQDKGESGAAAKKAEKAKQKQLRQISDSLEKAEWTQKIFVLVSPGYLLQYSRDGSFNRLPEKMMQLSSDSVAFASDAIPGKHWVIQISQGVDSCEPPASESRTLLSRLTGKGADYRRPVTSMLLVLDCAADMDSWLAVIRREIEALREKKHCSETEEAKPDEKLMQLKAQPSYQPLAAGYADQQSNPTSSGAPSLGLPSWVQMKGSGLEKELEEAISIMIDPPPPARPSTGHRSVTDSMTSNDGWRLDGLRDSTGGLSYMSSSQRTPITSQDSSPATSPTREKAGFDDIICPVTLDDNHLKPNPTLHERRRSFQPMQVLNLEPQASPASHREATLGSPVASATRSRSPGITPNFSVPNSSRKRFSTAQSPSLSQRSVESSPRDSIPEGTRKAVPTSRHLSRSPLSPVFDSPKSQQETAVITPTDTTFSFVTTTAKPTIVNIPPRQILPAAVTSSPLPKRVSSLMPFDGPESSIIDIQFPRRYSSLQPPRETSDEQVSLDEPLHAVYLPPAARSAPVPFSSAADIFPATAAPADARPKSRAGPDTALPVRANTKSKLRRPSNLQINATAAPFTLSPLSHSKALSPDDAVARPSSAQSMARAPTPAPHAGRLSPALLRARKEERKGLTARRSMPVLVEGPPPAPPPSCALPPLPSPGLRPKSAMGRRTAARVAE
ncbi:hypothetical protein B2J93_5365 [Marssonina coronariae]|uniref:PH domain-containing protein n=1 Tax=Diplocarpon coronariae TaxID=2795749 RepID=A0A218YYF9_9HELO|nr:hypothetical protein B2J93_5365 [Marssonina coronariae]